MKYIASTKSQQDVLLPYVEDGRLILIGATTPNPYFEVNHALLSRVRIVKLDVLNEAQLVRILRQALMDPVRGLGGLQLTCPASAGVDCPGCRRRCADGPE